MTRVVFALGAVAAIVGCAALRDVEPQVARIGDRVRLDVAEWPRPIVGWLVVSTGERVVVRGTDGRDYAMPREHVERVYIDLRQGQIPPTAADCPPQPRRRAGALDPTVGPCSRQPHWFPARLPVEGS